MVSRGESSFTAMLRRLSLSASLCNVIFSVLRVTQAE